MPSSIRLQKAHRHDPSTNDSAPVAPSGRPLLSPRPLQPEDLAVLRDLVRFGVMADDQIQRRYSDPTLARQRLARLHARGLISAPRARVIQNTVIYSASRYGAHIARTGLDWRTTHDGHLAHDLAVVDLADYLVAHEPGAVWKTEREIGGVLRQIGPALRGRGLRRQRRHTPDGLLLTGDKRLAIELEHSAKSEQRYIGICRWFAVELRLDGIRWYVDNPRASARIRRVNAEHGFGQDIQVSVEPFPPGVFVRRRASSWAP